MKSIVSIVVTLAVALVLSWGALADGLKGGQAASAVGAEYSKNATSLAEAWLKIPHIRGQACGSDLSFDYEASGGMRNFFCRALSVFSWRTFLSLAPVSPFLSGPHRAGKLDLNNPKRFGRYDPTFVRWASQALVPAAGDPLLRVKTQSIYEGHARDLARVYYKVYRVMDVDSSWRRNEVERYLRALKRGGLDNYGETVDIYHNLLGGDDENWGGHDPNHVRSATLWWLRRSYDETDRLWFDGLQRLLKTYDGAWLQKQQDRQAQRPPQRRVEKKPEYR